MNQSINGANTMNKQLTTLLKSCPVSARWLNMGTWTKEEYNNLLELVEQEGIKITKRTLKNVSASGLLKIAWNYGQMRVIRFSTFSDIKSDLVNLLAQKSIYLGDKFKITHHLRDYSN